MSDTGKDSRILKLKGILKIRLKLETESHLLIQAPKTSTTYRIGGADNRPVTIQKEYIFNGTPLYIEVPYIPGSSIKGRMRSLLEIALGKEIWKQDRSGKIWMHVRSDNISDAMKIIRDIEERCEIDEVFGSAAISYDKLSKLVTNMKKTDELFKLMAPTRLLVDNFYPSDDFVNKLFTRQGTLSLIDFVAEKSENRIDRITSTADPRSYLTVRPGVEFEGELKLQIYDIDMEKCPNSEIECWKRNLLVVLKGLQLLEETYLGSSGSRGYGSIKFTWVEINYIDIPRGPDTLIVEKQILSTRSLKEALEHISKNDIGLEEKSSAVTNE